MNNPKEQIIEVLSYEKRPVSISEIARKSGIHRQTVARNLDVLETLGKIRKIQKGVAKKYFLISSLPVSSLIDVSSDLTVIINPNLEIQYVNNAAIKYFSLSLSQTTGKKLSVDTIPLISNPEIMQELEHYSFENVIKKTLQSEQGTWFEITIIGISLLFSPNLIAIIATDISERMAIEQQLKKSEHLFRLLVETTKYTLTILDPVTHMHRYVSPSVLNFVGYTQEEFIQTPLLKIIDPRYLEWFKQLVAGGLTHFQLSPDDNIFYTEEIPLISKNGSLVWIEATYRFLINEDTGKPEIVAVSRDITERKTLENDPEKT